jgi:hypothetical protein
METVNVQVSLAVSGWEWRVVDGQGRLRLAGTHPTREEAVETGRFWLTQVQVQEQARTTV